MPASNKFVQRKMEKQGLKNMVLPGTIRVKMLETFCKEDERFDISDFELKNDRARTGDVMREIQHLYSEDEIFLILRADKLSIIPKWNRRNEADEFLTRFNILATAYEGEDPAEIIASDAYLNNHRNSFQILSVPEKLSDVRSSKARQYLNEQNQKSKQMFNSEIWHILTAENAQMYFGICRFKGDNDFLSNYYEAPINYNGIVYRNNEVAFQAQKVSDEKHKYNFANLTANKAKSLGRGVSLRSDWEEVKLDIMY